MKLILTIGLPASGKTTWANQYCQDNPDTVLICKDDLREQLHSGGISKGKLEKRVLQVRDRLTEQALHCGQTVIWADTNLNPIHTKTAKQFADKYGAELVLQSFTDVPVQECIRRDNARPNGVGESVIKQMFYKFLYKPLPAPVYDSSLPLAVIVDVDGTLAENTTRSPHDFSRVSEDKPYKQVFDMVLAMQCQVVVMSGRSDICREATYNWLVQHGLEPAALLMRTEGDYRPDEIVKRELYEKHVAGKYNVSCVVDDRPKVCRMWRDLGLFTFQVGNPEYEF